jgi:hypothetical protein
LQHLWRNLKNITHNDTEMPKSTPTLQHGCHEHPFTYAQRKENEDGFSKSKLERKSLNLRKKQKSATHVPPTRLSPQCPIQGLRWQWVPMSLQIKVLPALPLSVAASQLSHCQGQHLSCEALLSRIPAQRIQTLLHFSKDISSLPVNIEQSPPPVQTESQQCLENL